MFSVDMDRVIPRRRINWVGILLQVLLIVFLLLYFAVAIFEYGDSELFNLVNRYYIPIFLVLFLGFPLVVSLYTRWDQRRKWNQLAEEMGLHIEQASRLAFPEINGTHRGHRISITQTSERRGRSRVYFTNFTIQLSIPASANFVIQKRSLTHINRELTGDEELDKKLTVKISSKRLLQQILKTKRLRQGLLELGERSRTKKMTLLEKNLIYTESGQIRDNDYMRAVLTYLVELASLIERSEQIGY